MSQKSTYSESGVDIKAGDDAALLIQAAMRRTHGPRVISRENAFAGMFRLDYNEKIFRKNYKDPVLVACTDGVGTKVKLAIEMNKLDTIGIDCVAMNVNDLLVQGAEPLFFLDYLGLDKQVPDRTVKIIEGIVAGCELAGCALIGGECAEMPSIYAKNDFDIAGFTVGVVELKRAVDGTRVRPGDKILGLASSGLHSNGYSLVRNILKAQGIKLETVYSEVDPIRSIGEVLLEPTRIYVKSILKTLKNYRVKKPISAMAHVTGGGISGNLVRNLPNDCDAILNKKSWIVPKVFNWMQEIGSVESIEMDRVFNMGIGYLLVVRDEFSNSISNQLQLAGERVFEIGKIVKGSGEVKFVKKDFK